MANRGKRISVTVGDSLHRQLMAIVRRYGFTSVASLAAAALRIVSTSIENDRGASEDPDPDYIGGMFKDYAQWERQPEGTEVPKRTRRRSVYDGERR